MNLTDVFLKILNMSFTGAVIAVMIMWVRLLYRVLPKKYLCFMWCVVLIRLLCPFTLPELGIGKPIQEPIPSNIMEISEPYIASDIEVIDNTVNRVLQQNFTPEVGASVNPVQIVMTLGSYLWLAGIIGMLIFTGWKLYQFYKTVREGVPDRTLDKRIYRCAVATPVVTGILVPKIYLPFSLEEPQLSHVLVHEKMHIQRKDHILKLLFYIALIIHWFNPFVWISYRLLERDMEMACDEAVLEKLGDDEKKNYCESLLDLASSKNHFVGNPVAFGESDVKLRIKNVLNYKKPRFWLSVIAIVILIITTLNCLNGPKSAVEMTETADWGIVLAVEDVTPKGLTIICTQNDETLEGELYSSSFYILSQYIDEEWVEMENILPENEIAWPDGAWMISKGGAEEWEVNWETLYGELSEGQYRIGKKIMCSVPRNLETEWYYAEFVIGDNVQLNTKNLDEAFYEILCDAYYLGKVNGKEFAISNENGYGKGVFALYDIDGDGFDELLLNLTDDSEQRTYAYIWGYNNGNTYVELCGGPLMNYYNNGIIEDGWSYKNELSGDFYPYSVYRYNEETDTYQSFGSVDAWNKKVSEINSEGKTFPSSIDADQDGIVYYILPSDWNGKYNIEPVDGNAYTNWRNGYLNGSEKISRFSAYELTEDYMKSVFEIKN